MIAQLTGTLTSKGSESLILDVNGVGYDVRMPESSLSELPGTGNSTTIFIHTHVREDDITLYGFLRPSDKDLFRRLIKIPGIGPRTAVALLSHLPGPALVGAVVHGKLAQIKAVPGIGKKTAERIILELKDKLSDLDGIAPHPESAAVPGRDELHAALKNLGFKQSVIEGVVREARKRAEKDAGFEDLLRLALTLIE